MRNENTLIEYSPSGDGVHGWFFGKPVHCGAGSVNKWIEPYAHPSHRFMTVTGVPFNGQTDIGEGQGFLDWLHVKFKTAPSAAKGVAAGAKTYSSDDTSSETVQEWLTFIDPDGREKSGKSRHGSQRQRQSGCVCDVGRVVETITKVQCRRYARQVERIQRRWHHAW